MSISKREVQRLLTEKQQDFLDEARDVLRAGWRRRLGYWSMTPAHAVKPRTAFAQRFGQLGCTQIGNDWFTRFDTHSFRTWLNLLDLLRAGHTDYVINEAAFGYMHSHGLTGPLIACLAKSGETRLADQAA